VANFAVLRKVDFMANLASGATVSCEVNRFLMNVLFSNYKNLHEKGSITEKQLLDELTFNSKVMLHRYISASSENKGDFDTSQTSGEWGLGSPEFESLLNGSKPPPGWGDWSGGTPLEKLVIFAIWYVISIMSISRGMWAIPGSATLFFHNCIAKSVLYCGGWVVGTTPI